MTAPKHDPAEIERLIARHRKVVSNDPDEASRRLSEWTIAALLAEKERVEDQVTSIK